MVKAVFIVAGHGLGDTGAVDNGAVGDAVERKEVVEIAEEVVNLLVEQRELHVFVYGIGIRDRMNIAQKSFVINEICEERGYKTHDALLISIHCNSGGGTGVETFFYAGDKTTEKLATNIADCMEETTGLRKRGVKPDTATRHKRLGIIRNTKPLACLVECGFVDHVHDTRILLNPEDDDVFAEGIVKGIMRFLDLPYNERGDKVPAMTDFLTTKFSRLEFKDLGDLKDESPEGFVGIVRGRPTSIWSNGEEHYVVVVEVKEELYRGVFDTVGEAENIDPANSDIVRVQWGDYEDKDNFAEITEILS